MPTISSVFPGGSGGTLGLRELVSPPSATVDIILIHGLGGNSFDTWLHEDTGTFWPTELLGRDLPTARILTFGYDADVVKFFGQVGLGTVRDHASTLVGEVASKRGITNTNTNTNAAAADRPIILVAHSLGGLIAKKALLISASAVEESYRTLDRNVRGISFLGTPHRGSDLAELGSSVGKIVKIFTTVNTPIVDILRRGSELAWDIHSDFCTWLRRNAARANVLCFWEEQKHRLFGTVVAKDSAAIDGYLLMPIPSDHVGMCKFASVHVPGYVRVLGTMRDWLDQPALSEESAEQAADGVAIKHQTTGAVMSQLRPEGKEFVLKLWFRQMFAREDEVESPYGDTCSWISEIDAFSKWESSNNGVFWILGHPGTGKSIMLKHAVDVARSKDLAASDKRLVLSHFFLGTGTPLQQSIDGLLRSLIYQIVSNVPSAFAKGVEQILRRRGLLPQGEQEVAEWEKHDLLAIFDLVLAHALESRDVRIYIDDLHECRGTTDEVRDLCRVLQEISKIKQGRSKQVAICLSSRYFPVYSPAGLSSFVKMEEHSNDAIWNYARHKLVFPSAEAITDLSSVSDIDIQFGIGFSPGPRNFRWVSSLTKRALVMFESGHSMAAIEEMIPMALPDDLIKIYDRLIQSITSSELSMSLRLLELLCFCHQDSVSLSTIRHFLNHEYEDANVSIARSGGFKIVDNDHLARLIPNLACGLIGVSQSGDHQDVELMHPTVKQYMMQTGFTFLGQMIASPQTDLQSLGQRTAGLVLSSCAASMARLEPKFKALSEKYREEVMGAAIGRYFTHDRFTEVITENIETLEGVMEIGDDELTAEFVRVKIADGNEEADGSEGRPSSRLSDAPVVIDADSELLSSTSGAETICCLADIVSCMGTDNADKDYIKNALPIWVVMTAKFKPEEREGDHSLASSVELFQVSSEAGFKWFFILSLLVMATTEKHTDLVKVLLDRSITKLRAPQMSFGLVMALQCAVYANSMDILALLLADPDMVVDAKLDGDTALTTALENGSAQSVKLLLERGASLLVKQPTGQSTVPLIFPETDISHETVTAVLEHVDKTSRGHAPPAMDSQYLAELRVGINRALPKAIKSGNVPLTRVLLDHKADPNLVPEAALDGQRPLHLAAGQGNGALINMLLKAGAIMDTVDDLRRTPLHLAASKANVTACNVLLLRGAKVDARDVEGHTPLFRAGEFPYGDEFSATVKTLLAFRANIEASFDDGPDWTKSLLGVAITKGETNVTQMLLDRGAASVFRQKYNKHVFHAALYLPKEATLNMLINRPDVDVNAAEDGTTPLHILATSVGRWGFTTDLMKLLLSRRDLEPNVTDKWGHTPLHIVAKDTRSSDSELEFLKLLLARDDLEVDKMDDHGRTALHHAAETNKADAVALLLKDSRTDVNGRIGSLPVVSRGEYFAKLQDRGGTRSDCAGERSHFVPIFPAAKQGYLRVVQLLLGDPALHLDDDATVRNGSKFHALSCLQAAAAGQRRPQYCIGTVFSGDFIEIVRLLCQRTDLNINKNTVDGTALDIVQTAIRARQGEAERLRRYLRRNLNSVRSIMEEDEVEEMDTLREYAATYLDEYDAATFGEGNESVQDRIGNIDAEIDERKRMGKVLRDFGAVTSDGPSHLWDRSWRFSTNYSTAYWSAIRCLWKRK